MAISVFDLFSIGIGPSSSHTVGPMRAAHLFTQRLESDGLFGQTAAVVTDLYGSLSLTGLGHGTDKAILLGLAGEMPETVDPDKIDDILATIRRDCTLQLAGQHRIAFDEKQHLNFHTTELPHHPNGMRFTALNSGGETLLTLVYYSVGGGFVAGEATIARNAPPLSDTDLPLEFSSGDELLEQCEKYDLTVSQLMRVNERFWAEDEEIDAKLDTLIAAMAGCIDRGCHQKGELPTLGIKRRAPELLRRLETTPDDEKRFPKSTSDWVCLFALAVNEENAAGSRVVTAPTNGAAGIIPAVLEYYKRFIPDYTPEKARDFMLTAGAIGMLYKENASISGAEVGCQGEVGVACSMAAGALAEVMGGTVGQVENAAEIGMEHNLGLTCDPVGGLVQVPCIERNAMGAVKAINAARLALYGDGKHFVSLDKVIQTMNETGRDMQNKYKETALGGLASHLKIPVNVIEC